MPKAKTDTISARLQRLRESAGLTRGALAAKAGIDRAYYGRLEAGEVTNPSFQTICRVANALGVDLCTFCEKATKK